MSLLISSVYTYDADASAYILAVEAADGQTLEPATRSAINKFVVGCKADGIWAAIKASCIMAGARTFSWRLGAAERYSSYELQLCQLVIMTARLG